MTPEEIRNSELSWETYSGNPQNRIQDIPENFEEPNTSELYTIQNTIYDLQKEKVITKQKEAGLDINFVDAIEKTLNGETNANEGVTSQKSETETNILIQPEEVEKEDLVLDLENQTDSDSDENMQFIESQTKKIKKELIALIESNIKSNKNTKVKEVKKRIMESLETNLITENNTTEKIYFLENGNYIVSIPTKNFKKEFKNNENDLSIMYDIVNAVTSGKGIPVDIQSDELDLNSVKNYVAYDFNTQLNLENQQDNNQNQAIIKWNDFIKFKNIQEQTTMNKNNIVKEQSEKMDKIQTLTDELKIIYEKLTEQNKNYMENPSDQTKQQKDTLVDSFDAKVKELDEQKKTLQQEQKTTNKKVIKEEQENSVEPVSKPFTETPESEIEEEPSEIDNNVKELFYILDSDLFDGCFFKSKADIERIIPMLSKSKEYTIMSDKTQKPVGKISSGQMDWSNISEVQIESNQIKKSKKIIKEADEDFEQDVEDTAELEPEQGKPEIQIDSIQAEVTKQIVSKIEELLNNTQEQLGDKVQNNVSDSLETLGQKKEDTQAIQGEIEPEPIPEPETPEENSEEPESDLMEEPKDNTENSFNPDLTTDDILNEEPKDDEDDEEEEENLEESYSKDGNTILNEQFMRLFDIEKKKEVKEVATPATKDVSIKDSSKLLNTSKIKTVYPDENSNFKNTLNSIEKLQ